MSDTKRMTPSDIIDLSATSLALLIATKELSSIEVVRAFIDRIEKVNPRLNAVVWPTFEKAIEDARAADDLVHQRGSLPPLHGVPITIKEMFDVENTPTTAGLTSLKDHRAKRDADAVKQLRAAGAIVLGKTNVPLLGLKLSTENPLYGTTNNPWDLTRTPGGSSGGEGAIIAAQGSPLGLGSDAGGSIRHPSHCCGIVGLKATGGRFAMRGHWSVPNWCEKWSQLGPMARSVDDLKLFMRTLGDQAIVSNGEHRFGFQEFDGDLRKVRIGFYQQLSWLEPAKAVKRAIDDSVNSLTNDGFELVPFTPPDFEDAWRIFLGILYADSLRFFKQASRQSRLDGDIRQMYFLANMPSVLRRWLGTFYPLIGQRGTGQIMRMLRKKSLSAAGLAQLKSAEIQYQSKFKAAMDQHKIDLLLCPVSPMPAFCHSDFECNFTMMYTGLYNLLGLPAGAVPVTVVKTDEPYSDRDRRDKIEKCFDNTERNSDGLPIGVQVVGRWWREDLVLALMSELENRSEFQRRKPSFSRSRDRLLRQ